MIRGVIFVTLLLAALGSAVYFYGLKLLAEDQPKVLKIEALKPDEKPVMPALIGRTEAVEKVLIDPFVPRVSLGTAKSIEAARKKAKLLQGEQPTAEKQAAKPKLEGLSVDAESKIAFISGRALTEGAMVLGWEVSEITETEVVLKKERKIKILRLGGE
ncbi:MAG: hypothetical protein ABID35_03565 [Candidatus Margulisiibacteriota bacterium]